MAMYEYECSVCDWKGDRLSSIKERDNQFCKNQVLTATAGETEMCCMHLQRTEIPSSVSLDTKGSFQTKAIFEDGTKKDGHFGRSARKQGARYKP